MPEAVASPSGAASGHHSTRGLVRARSWSCACQKRWRARAAPLPATTALVVVRVPEAGLVRARSGGEPARSPEHKSTRAHISARVSSGRPEADREDRGENNEAVGKSQNVVSCLVLRLKSGIATKLPSVYTSSASVGRHLVRTTRSRSRCTHSTRENDSLPPT